MEHLVNMLATVVATLAVAALSLFGVKIEPRQSAPAERPAVVIRAADEAPAQARPVARQLPVAER